MKLYHIDLERIYRREPDLQAYFDGLRKRLKNDDRISLSYRNVLWSSVPWYDKPDIENLFNLSGFEVITSTSRQMIARPHPGYRQLASAGRRFSVSIVIPAKNEEGNISKIIPSIPRFGKFQEFIFTEGYSKDNTWGEIEKEIKRNHKKYLTVVAFKQRGKGKARAIWQGLKKAKGDILMVYDADRTVNPKDLTKFYNVLSAGFGEFANGNRLLYPMEGDAMQTLNKIGNLIFSWLFTWILGQRFKDTLCGTKAFWAKDFARFKYSHTDPFGDFDLIFGAIRKNLKVVDIPVRYKERVYGATNINRFYHGLLLLKMTFLAFLEFKT